MKRSGVTYDEPFFQAIRLLNDSRMYDGDGLIDSLRVLSPGSKIIFENLGRNATRLRGHVLLGSGGDERQVVSQGAEGQRTRLSDLGYVSLAGREAGLGSLKGDVSGGQDTICVIE
jgi:hypothetical protein